MADWLCIIVEGARQRGFEIKKLGKPPTDDDSQDYLADEAKRAKTRELLKSVKEDTPEVTTLKMLERTFGC